MSFAPHDQVASRSGEVGATGSKRKRGDKTRFYAVRSGHRPGIYHTWDECREQVNGYEGKREFKAFPTLSEAEAFLKHGLAGTNSVKFYAVRVGRAPGVYTDWPSANKQVQKFANAKHRSFHTKVEAEAYVQGSDVVGDGSAAAKSKKAKTNSNMPEAPELDEINYDVEAGAGPLPKGAVDGFDSRIRLDPSSGNVEYKTEEQRHATKMVSTGLRAGESLHIYTDGSSLGNGQVGATSGVGVYFGPRDARNISEGLEGERQTNQRAELTAVGRAVDIAPRDRDIVIHTDSKYSIQCLTDWFQAWRRNGWLNSAKKPVENKDLIEPILSKIDERKRCRSDTKFEYVKGHSGEAGNEAADHLATEGARKALQQRLHDQET